MILTGADAIRWAGPLRATETEARRDAESPESVLWHVIGHLCG